MAPARVIQSTANKTDVVCRTATATGLSNNQGNLVQIVLTAFQGRNHLTGYQQRRIAGIVVYIFKTGFYSLRVYCVENYKVVAAGTKGLFQNLKMNRRHLRSDDCIVLAHLFCKDYAVIS